jgi:type IV pilus assembly protein PilQ
MLYAASIGLMFWGGLTWAADQTNRLISVGKDVQAELPTVLMRTSEPVGYRYTVYDSFDPIRVVVDFPGMDVKDLPEVTPINQGALREIHIKKFDLASGSLTRVEIILEKATDYQVTLDKREFRLAFGDKSAIAQPDKEASKPQAPASPAPVPVPEAAPAARVSEVPSARLQSADVLEQVSITPGLAILKTNGNIDKYKYTELDSPPRLVIDIYGVRPGFQQRSFAAENGIKQIRIGVHQDKTRLVFDAAYDTLPAYEITQKITDIEVSWQDSAKMSKPHEKADTLTLAAFEESAANEMDVKPESTAGSEPVAVAAVEPASTEVVASTTTDVEKQDSQLQEETVLKATPAEPVNPTFKTSTVEVKSIEFLNDNGRSILEVKLSEPADVTSPVREGNLVRFEIKNARITRALRRTIDASAFPSAMMSATPYTVTERNVQNVRVAIDLRGPVAYALEQDDNVLKFVVDDGAYAEPAPAQLTQVEVTAPKSHLTGEKPSQQESLFDRSLSSPQTADEMAIEATKYTGEKISLVFDSADVRSILQLIGDVSGLNVLASSDVGGTITLRLIDVPWDQALDLVLETANLGKIQDGNVLRVMPISKIREREQAVMKAKQEDIEVGILETRVFEISYTSVDDMKTFLNDLKSERGSIIADSRNKQLIVKDVVSVLNQMSEMISQVDRPERQVLIEARIVEASTTFARDLGVKWNFDYQNERNPRNTTKGATDLDQAQLGLGGSFLIPVTNPSAAGVASAIAFGGLDDSINIDLRLSALESSGEGRIVSTPRVSTLNGEKAVIAQGTKIPFSTVSDTGTDITFENAELKLEVTPEINPDGSVILEINTSNSSVGNVVPTATGNAVSIDEKKAETKVLVRDGQTTVIGGIFVESEQDGATGVPILKDIPIMGHLFKSTTKSRERRELLIFITPRILES